jgi:hypothetical protein
MFHKNNVQVIESTDIESLRASQVETLPDGTVIARLSVVLRPHKAYIESPALHVTDGVLPRLLHPTPAPISPEKPVDEADENEDGDEESSESSPKEKKSKK